MPSTSQYLRHITHIAEINDGRESREQTVLEDREFGITHKADTRSDLKNIQTYLNQHASLASSVASDSMGARLWIASLIIALIGWLIGATTSSSLLSYDGTQPVNVLQFLAVIFGVQLVSLAFFILGLIGLRSNTLGKLLNAFSLTHWVSSLTLRHDGVAWASKVPLRVWQALILRRAQVFIVFFMLGALSSLIYKASISDLAFGWSTTLEMSNQTFFIICQKIAAIWQPIFPGVGVDQPLIDETRFFRLRGEDAPNTANANTYGRWWSFLALTIAIWGVVTRIFTWIIALVIERRTLKNQLISSSAAQRILDRLKTPLISTQSPSAEATFIQPAGDATHVVNRIEPSTNHVIFVGAFEAKNVILEKIGCIGATTFEVGSHRSLEEDNAVISTLKAIQSPIAVIVKAWEPPIMDTMDFFEEVLEHNTASSLTIVPIASDFAIAAIDPVHFDSWQRALGRFNPNRVSLFRSD